MVETGEYLVSDAPVVRAAEEFDAFYAREFRPVIGLAFVLSGSRSAAEELTQEAFLVAYRRWDHIGLLDTPGAWVRRAVANRSVSRFRRTTPEAKALLRFRMPRVVPEFAPETLDVWDAVRKLPKRQAQTIALHYLHDLQLDEIAAILNCSVETVRTHLKRARSALAERLGP